MAGPGLLDRLGGRGAVVGQGLLLAAVVLAGFGMVRTARETVARQNIATGFDLLTRPTGWDVSFSLLPHGIHDPYWWTFLIGLVNTLLVGGVCVVCASLLGVLLAMLRATENPLLGAVARSYVVTIRNVPQIVQVFFWYHLTRQLPPVRQAIPLLDLAFLSNRGLQMPSLAVAPGSGAGLALLVAAAVAGGIGAGWIGRRMLGAGAVVPGLGAAVLVLAAGLAVMNPGVALERPVLRGFNFVGGALLPPEFLALVAAITIYNTAFVAEIIRSGLSAVPRGQIEAARNLGLSDMRVFWRITLPQALRVIVPPMTNQFISIVKSSSLAVAIGLTDLFTIGTIAINHTGQAMEIIALLMVVYLAISLTISGAGHWVNAAILARGAR